MLDGLIQNAGSRFQKTFADEPLLERLRLMARDDMVDPDVRKKVNVLFRQWAVAYKDTTGLSSIAVLSKQLPQTQRRPAQAQSKVLRETEAEAQASPFDDELPQAPPTPQKTHSRKTSNVTPSSSASTSRPVALSSTPHFSSAIKSKSSKKDKNAKVFNLEKEKPNIMQTIASSSVASTNLLNALQLINRETQRVSDNAEVLNRFETCKALRRQILRYIQLVEHDDWIGSLLSANDELVKALMSYEIMDKSLEDDSDSDGWERPSAEDYIAAAKFESQKTGAATSTESQLAGLNLSEAAPPKPPRPSGLAMPSAPTFASSKEELESESEPEDEEDDDDPFGDSNAVKTPGVERAGMSWKRV